MKKITLHRHIDDFEDGLTLPAGSHTLTEAQVNRLESKGARFDVVEDLTPQGKPVKAHKAEAKPAEPTEEK